jgi:preprotein translocase subunit SecD
MSRQWKGRVYGLIALIALAFATLLPTLTGFMYPKEKVLPDQYRSFFKNQLVLGLDLQGGIHLEYQVDTKTALINKSRNMAARLQAEIPNPNTKGLKDLAGASVEVKFNKKGDLDAVSSLAIKFTTDKNYELFKDQAIGYLNGYYPDYEWLNASSADKTVNIGLSRRSIAEFQEGALSQAIETIERRINTFGVAETSVSRRDDDKIVVELPGLDEEEFSEKKKTLAQTGLLHFKIVEYDKKNSDDFYSKARARRPQAGKNWPKELALVSQDHKVFASGNTIRSTSREILEHMVGDLLENTPDHLVGFQKMYVDPDNVTLKEIATLSTAQEKEIDQEKEFNPKASVVQAYELYYLRLDGMSGENVEDASVGSDQYGRPVTNMRFSNADAGKFADLTGRNVDKQLAILIDDMVYSAPNIQDRIGGGRVQITMGGGGARVRKEAEALAAVLKSGALQAPLRQLYSSEVGPTLGKDSIEAGKISILLGFLFVICFMVFYYRVRGIVANVALLLNLFFIAAGLAMFGATLTLPGIAGIVLTVGMAVDANVLIFERMKEEERKRSVTEAFSAGYEKAWSAILDANITTGIAAVVLYQFGTGPIKGFAVTLGLGIISSMYTAIVVTRLIFEYIYHRQQADATA